MSALVFTFKDAVNSWKQQLNALLDIIQDRVVKNEIPSKSFHLAGTNELLVQRKIEA
jgi:hypothetical protein